MKSSRAGEIEWDGKTVWVHYPTGETVGRFSRFGMDVHRTIAEQMQGGTQCLACTHEKPDWEGWKTFKARIWEHYKIVVPDAACPGFIQRGRQLVI